MMHPKGMVLLFMILNIDNTTVLAHSCGKTVTVTGCDCETLCGYVTGEAEAACKSSEGWACIGESAFPWLADVWLGIVCKAAAGACTATEAVYIAQQRECEEYCDRKFPSKELTQRNINATRQVLVNGQTQLKNNLKKLSDSIANNHKDITMQLISAQEEIIDNIVEEVKNSQSLILNSTKVSQGELLSDIKQFFNVPALPHLGPSFLVPNALPLLKAINIELDALGKHLEDVKHAILFGDVFNILNKVEAQYNNIKHDPSTGLIVPSFDSDQYVSAVTDYNEGMRIGIQDIMDMLVTGNGRKWIKGNSIYQESPSEFCFPKWFDFFQLRLTKALFHYRLGRKMQGNLLPASHKEKKFHDEHLEHYLNVCQCKHEDLPMISGRTPICSSFKNFSTSTVGEICRLECWAGEGWQDVTCEEGGNWRVDETWIERDDNANWICKARDVLWIVGATIPQTFLLPDFNWIGEYHDCHVADPGMDESKSVFQEVEGKVYGCNHVECKQYFPEENTWRIIPGTKFVSERAGATGTLVDGKWVVQGGRVRVNYEWTNVPTAEVWTPGAESWVEAPEYKTPPLPVYGHCTVTVKDKTMKTMKTMLIGGFSSASGDSTSRCFLDGEEVASLKAPRQRHACAVFQGQVWVAGGYRDGGDHNVVEIYDPSTNTWREGPPRPTNIVWYGTSAIDWESQLLVDENTDQLYYIGGEDIGKIYRLSQNKDAWEEVANILKGQKHAPIVIKKRC